MCTYTYGEEVCNRLNGGEEFSIEIPFRSTYKRRELVSDMIGEDLNDVVTRMMIDFEAEQAQELEEMQREPEPIKLSKYQRRINKSCEGGEAVCDICLDNVKSMVANCGHPFCEPCLHRVKTEPKFEKKCTFCRSPITKVYKHHTAESFLSEDDIKSLKRKIFTLRRDK